MDSPRRCLVGVSRVAHSVSYRSELSNSETGRGVMVSGARERPSPTQRADAPGRESLRRPPTDPSARRGRHHPRRSRAAADVCEPQLYPDKDDLVQTVLEFQADTAFNNQREGAAQFHFVAGGSHGVDLASQRLARTRSPSLGCEEAQRARCRRRQLRVGQGNAPIIARRRLRHPDLGRTV